MNQRLKTNGIRLWVLSAAFLAQPCSSEYGFGYSNNAASGGSTWGMSSSLFALDSVQGVEINGVIYRYTVEKLQADPYTVSIQNKAANGNGYIFRSVDDWSGKSGTTIQRYIPVPYSPLGEWGEGAINEVGLGEVIDPSVVYTYRVDTCAGVTTDPNCPDYLPTAAIAAPITPYDPLSDPFIEAALAPTDLSLVERDSEENGGDDADNEENRLETGLAASQNALTEGMALTQAAILQAMNMATNLSPYYQNRLIGGVYVEKINLKDGQINDNPAGKRLGLAQQAKHEKMVIQQWR